MSVVKATTALVAPVLLLPAALWAQPPDRETTSPTEAKTDDEVSIKGFRLDGVSDLKGIKLDIVPKGPPMNKMMTKEEMEETGFSRLSATEKAALEKWIGKLLFFTAFRVARDTKVAPNQKGYRGQTKIYHYHMQTAPSMLDEESAVKYARMTFAKEGHKLEQWKLTRADNPPSKAPDGTPDTYFDRFSFRPTEGRVHFTDGRRVRTVQVRLEGNWVVCSMFYGM